MEEIDVRILDRDYRLAVSADEKATLLEAVRVVDERMRAVRDAGRVGALDRVAVMAALQIAVDLVAGRQGKDAAAPELARRLKRISDDLEAGLRRQENLF